MGFWVIPTLISALWVQGWNVPADVSKLFRHNVAWIVHQVVLPPDGNIFHITPKWKGKKQEQLGISPQMRNIIRQSIQERGVDKADFWVMTPSKKKAFNIVWHWYQSEQVVEYEIVFFLGGANKYSVRLNIASPNAELLFRLTNVLGLILWGKYKWEMEKIDIAELYKDLQSADIVKKTSSNTQ